jgi:hypothetical protein
LALTAALVLAGIGLGAERAAAYDARVRWLPSADPDVVGYRIWVRAALRPYARPIDAGRPRRAADGSMSHLVRGLGAGGTYHFAVSAYTRELESRRSREIALGPTDPCLVDECAPTGGCAFGVREDGSPCGTGDPCRACRAGRCGVLPQVELTTARMLFDESDGATRIALRGRFPVAERMSPGVHGLALVLVHSSGDTLWEAAVPAPALRRNTLGTFFRRIDRGAVSGLHRVVVRVRDGTLRVSAGILSARLPSLAGRSDLRWVVRLGAERCAVGATVSCRGKVCR